MDSEANMNRYWPMMATANKWKASKNNALALGLGRELVEDPKESKNWKSIVIALFVIVTVLGLVITAIVLVTPGAEEEKTGDKLTFREFLEDKYKPVEIEPLWLSDQDAFIYRNNLGELILFNCSTNETSVFLDNSSFREVNTDIFQLSADRNYVLFQYDVRQIYTFSRLFRVKIYNIRTKLFLNLIGPFGYDIQYVTWSPTDNTIIFVQENNIYLKKIHSSDIYYVTKSGVRDRIYNGIPDWLYGERILKSDHTLWISPSGAYIAFAEIDDTHVTKYHSILYGDPKEPYITETIQSYPKAGSKNPSLKLILFDVRNNKSHTLQAPNGFRNSDYYVTRVSWQSSESILIQWLNRAQNTSVITVCSVITVLCRENYRYATREGRIETNKQTLIKGSGDEYFIILPQLNGPSGIYEQIASIDSKALHSDGSRIFLTHGKSEVVKLVGYDQINNTLFYIAVPERDTKTRHLYSIETSRDSSTIHQPRCLTCDIPDCHYYDAKFSFSGRYYLLECLGPGVPFYDVYQAPEIYVQTIEGNDNLRQLLSSRMLPSVEYIQVPLLDSEDILQAKLLLPQTDEEVEDVLQYNLLVIIDRDPGTHVATQTFHIGWEYVLSSLHSIIIAYIDTSASSGGRTKWRHGVRRNIGKADMDVIIAAIKHLKTLEFVHETAGIFGSEYGGHIAASLLTKDDSIFNCGVAASPITDWLYMDSFYAERYMGFPDSSENWEGYNDANISKYAAGLKDSSLLLMHGTSDSRVHFQNTAQLIKALTRAGKLIKSQIYPDVDNIFKNKLVRSHVYVTIEKYILGCFGLPFGSESAPVVEDEEEE